MALIRLYNYYKSKRRYKEAIEYFKKITELEPNCVNTKLFGYTVIGELYMSMKEYDKGLQYCEDGLHEVKECNDKTTQFGFYSRISQLYFLTDKFEFAEQYLKEAIQCFETFFGSLGGNDHFKISIVDNYNGCFKLYIVTSIPQNQSGERSSSGVRSVSFTSTDRSFNHQLWNETRTRSERRRTTTVQ
jgi:tetratricopeptide (TPR) repeat protein